MTIVINDETYQLITSFYDEKSLQFLPRVTLPIDIEAACIRNGIRYPDELQTVNEMIKYLNTKGIYL